LRLIEPDRNTKSNTNENTNMSENRYPAPETNNVANIPAARLLVVDDELPARKRLSDLIDDCRAILPLTLVDEAANGVDALNIIEKNHIDIVLTDIRMPVMDGIELAQHISRMDPSRVPKIIFITAYDQYALKAFDLNAVDYLLKPIKQERLLAALKKARSFNPTQADAIAEASQNKRRHLSIHERGRVVLVPIDDVLYLKAELKYLTVRTLQKEYLLEESLTKLEEEFAGMFTRLHRNCIVATKAITGFERLTVPAMSGAKAAPGTRWSASTVIPASVGTHASSAATPADSESEDEDATSTSGGQTLLWVCNVRGIPERLAVSRRQQHVIRDF
jgi:two-component system, LytTR family, response regulator AlgR